MTRRRASGTRRTTTSSRDSDGGDHLDQLLDDDQDTDDDADRDADRDDADDQDDDRDQGDDLDDDQDADADRDDDQDRGGRSRKGKRRRARTDDEDEDDDRGRPVTVEDLEKAAQRIADRQVNALLRRLGKPGARDQQDQNDRGRRRRDDRDRDRDVDSGRDDTRQQDEQRRYDEREARLAFRDYVGADGRNLATTEREIANTLARVEITTRLDEHGDPDRAGREAADRVTDQLTEFRRLVEKQTVAALRKRGALRERGTTSGDEDDTVESGNAGGSRPPGRAPSPAKLADKRQAAKSFAADYNTRLGHTTTTDAGSKTG